MDKELYVIGVDYGSDSVRSVLVNAKNGKEISASVFYYPRWQKEMFCDASKNQFRQHPLDYVEGLENTIKECLEQAGGDIAKSVKGIAIDTTGSTPVAVNKEGIIVGFAGGGKELRRVEGVDLVARVQPWVAATSNIALYVLIVAIVIGYLPAMSDPGLWVAIGVGLVVLVLALFLGWTMGDGHGHLKEVGGLGTAQRGTAAALIVAQTNFDDPRILVVITLLNTFGVVLLIAAAKVMSRDNAFDFLLPQAADVPGEPSRTPTSKET